MSLLNSVSLGNHYFQVALVLRNSMFVNSVLTASEVWPHLSEGNYKLLEERDVSLLKRFFFKY